MYVLYCTGGLDLQGESIYNLWKKQRIISKLKQKIIFLDIWESVRFLRFVSSGKVLTDHIYNTLLMPAVALVYDAHLPLLQGRLQALLH